MKRNLGNLDRIIRVLFGGGLVAWALTGGPAWAWIGLVPVLTAVVGFCPAYCPIGLSTCGKDTGS